MGTQVSSDVIFSADSRPLSFSSGQESRKNDEHRTIAGACVEKLKRENKKNVADACGMEKKNCEHSSQLEQKDAMKPIAVIAGYLSSRFPACEVKVDHEYGLMIASARGARSDSRFKHRVSVNARGEMRLMLSGSSKCLIIGSLEELGEKIESHAPVAAPKRVDAKNLLKLIEKQGYTCALSGRKLLPDNVECDHKEPISVSLDHSLQNIQFVTREVNRAKGSMPNEAFIQLCNDVARAHPRPVYTPS